MAGQLENNLMNQRAYYKANAGGELVRIIFIPFISFFPLFLFLSFHPFPFLSFSLFPFCLLFLMSLPFPILPFSLYTIFFFFFFSSFSSSLSFKTFILEIHFFFHTCIISFICLFHLYLFPGIYILWLTLTATLFLSVSLSFFVFHV